MSRYVEQMRPDSSLPFLPPFLRLHSPGRKDKPLRGGDQQGRGRGKDVDGGGLALRSLPVYV